MKKHLHNSLRALFLSLAMLLSLPMLAVDIEGIEYWLDFETRQAAVHGNTWGYSGHIVIPETIEYEGTTYSVTRIMEQAFYGCPDLTSITIPSSLTSIGDEAFYDCYGLTSLYLSDIAAWCNVTFEGDMTSRPMRYAKHVYINGEEAKDLLIPDNVTSIGEQVFYNWSCLNSVTIPNSVTSIGESAFQSCSGLTSVTIGNNVTSIGDGAFWCCSSLTSVTIPNSVTSIGLDAFYGCSGLTSITIPNSVTSIVSGAFSGCSGLTSVTIGNSVKSIEPGAFYGCTSLKSITIPNSVESIEGEAFANCPELLDVYCYAENVPSIESDAFSPIADATLHVPAASLDSYKATAPWSSFKNIVAISTDVDGINYDFDADTKQATVIQKSGGEYSGEVVIPESVVYVGNEYSVTSIGEAAFFSCSGLTSVTIGNSVESIGKEAFQSCSGLTSVTIPNSVKSIGGRAFSSCSGLTSVTIGNSVESIGTYAFERCSGLTSVTIGNSVESIRGSAFDGCSGLTSVTIPNSVDSIGWSAFEGCSGLTSITIPNSVKSIGGYAFSGCSGLTSIVVEDGNPVYDSRNNCNAIIETATNTLHFGCKTTIIPNNVTSIGDYAFGGCSGLTSVTIPNSVTNIGGWAFFGCSGLTSVTIPNSVTSIGECAFFYCSGLTSVTIGNSVKSIGDNAFSWCSGLTSVTIPNSVKSIGDGAFYQCSGLTSVTIGSSVTSIGKWAFRDCPDLLDVYCYAENVPYAYSDAFDDSYPGYATLHVPNASIDSYKATWPWSGFGKITSILGTVTLTDGEEFKNNTEQTFSTLTYTRTLPNLKWNALYVPFEIPVAEIADKYEVAYINDINSYDYDDDGSIDNMSMEIIKIKSGTLKANYPYMIKASNEEAKNMSITLENTTLYPTVSRSIDCSSVYARHEVTGIYERKTQNELPEGAMAISVNGVWQPIASGSYLNPFRLYMTITSRDDSPVKVDPAALSRIRISVLGEDEMETGVEETENGNRKSEKVILDLSGRRVQNPTKGGVYIINGKKMVY